jgi:hypothetical protein
LDSIPISILGKGIVDQEKGCFLFRIMVPIPIDPDCIWNYSFCEWIDLGVEIDEDWYSMGNIEYDALDDLQGNFLQLLEKDNVPINKWDEMVQEPTEHDEEDSTDER